MNARFDPSRVRAILFDIDGTLADTDDTSVQRMTRWLRPFRRILPRRDPAAFARRLVMAAESPGNWLLGWLDRAGLDERVGPLLDTLHWIRGERSQRDWALVPGVEHMLEALAREFPLAIVTARDQRSSASFLETSGLGKYFSSVVTARTCRRGKPHPAPLRFAAEQLLVPAEHCLMVGDTTVDIRAGLAAGTQTVAVLCGFGEREELSRAGAHLLLESTADLERVLGSNAPRASSRGQPLQSA
jgi:phosphoglycolate phosphatase